MRANSSKLRRWEARHKCEGGPACHYANHARSLGKAARTGCVGSLVEPQRQHVLEGTANHKLLTANAAAAVSLAVLQLAGCTTWLPNLQANKPSAGTGEFNFHWSLKQRT